MGILPEVCVVMTVSRVFDLLTMHGRPAIDERGAPAGDVSDALAVKWLEAPAPSRIGTEGPTS